MSKTSKQKGQQREKKAALTEPVTRGRPSTLSDEVAEYWEAFQEAQPKAVHEVRKLTRRAGAEAEVSDLKKKVRREWRDLRRAAAPIRDHDAAGEHLRAALDELEASPNDIQRFETGWAARRAELVARHPLPAEVPAGYDLPEGWEARAAKALDADRKELLKQGKKLMKRVDGDSEPWHDWRKLMKRYRYTLELTGKAPKTVKTMLEHLGRLQDAEVLLELLETEHGHFSEEHLKALKSREKTARLQSRAAALELWPQLKAHLKGEELEETGVEDTQTAPAPAEVDSQPAPAAKPATKAATKKTATPKATATANTPAKESTAKPAAKAAAAKPKTASPKAKAASTSKAVSAKASPAKAKATASQGSTAQPGAKGAGTAKAATTRAKSAAAKTTTARPAAAKVTTTKTTPAGAAKSTPAKASAKASSSKASTSKASTAKAKAASTARTTKASASKSDTKADSES